MPKVSVLQPSFNAGEFSPLLYGRVDSDRYKSGLAVCANYIPTLQGPIVRRPGTKYVNNVKDSTKPPALIPFQFSTTQAYVFEFGNQYIRFYANGGQIVTNTTVFKVSGADSWTGNYGFTATRSTLSPNSGEIITATSAIAAGQPLELVSPYLYTDVPTLKWAQDTDTLYLTHPGYPPYKLQRSGNEYWTLKQVYFRDGPYLDLNSYTQVGDSTAITLTPTGSSVGIIATGPPTAVAGAIANSSGGIRLTVAANAHLTGDQVFVSGIVGTTEANNAPATSTNPYQWGINVIDSTHIDLVGSQFTNAYVGSGIVYPALFQLGPGGPGNWADHNRNLRFVIGASSFWGTVTLGIDAAHAGFEIGLNSPGLPNLNTVLFWQLGVWNGNNGYPASACFHQDRLWFSGTPQYPQEIDGSVVGDYENFAPSDPNSLQVNDNNSMQFTLNSTDSNSIRWMKSTAQGLLAGTQSSEWQVTPSSQSQALTPTNISAAQTSYFGSANIDAVQAGNATLHVQRAQRKLREMNYFFQVGTFRSTDLTEISEHITLPTITKVVVTKETQPIVWCVRSDGNFLAMVYNRDDLTLKVGWSRHQLGGQSDAAGTNPLVQSMAVIPSPDTTYDQTWMTVQRFINGSTLVNLEYMTKIYDDSFLQEDAYHFDCGVTFYNPTNIATIAAASSNILVTIPLHGFQNGTAIKFVGIVGLNVSRTDINGNVTVTNTLNEQTFLVGSSTATTFTLLNYQNVPIPYGSSSVYVSGGQAARLITTVSGLNWLVGETVSILADGAIHPNVTVQPQSSGIITLQFPAAKVQIGYQYNSDGQLLRPEAGAADGTSIGKTRRVCRVAVMLHDVGDFQMGMSFTDLIPVKFQQSDVQKTDNATPLFSGMHRDGVGSKYNFEGQFCFRQNTGLPGMIQASTLLMEEFDV